VVRSAAAGQVVEPKSVIKSCDKHQLKQKWAQLRVAYRKHHDTQVGRLSRAQIESEPDSPEYQSATTQLRAIDERSLRTQPGVRHRERMSAFYVDLAKDGQIWARPKNLSPIDCAETMTDAINDYTVFGSGSKSRPCFMTMARSPQRSRLCRSVRRCLLREALHWD
jgi:hypothetical protein